MGITRRTTGLGLNNGRGPKGSSPVELPSTATRQWSFPPGRGGGASRVSLLVAAGERTEERSPFSLSFDYKVTLLYDFS